jgi:hypothetical protein
MTAAAAVEVLQLGDRAVVDVVFTVGGAPPGARPAVTWRVWPPGATTPTAYVSGVAPEATPITGDNGAFRLSVACSAAGLWEGRAVATGACEGAEKFRFFVEADPT